MHFVRSKVCTNKLQSKCILSKIQSDGLAVMLRLSHGKGTMIMSHRAGLKPGVVLHGGGHALLCVEVVCHVSFRL